MTNFERIFKWKIKVRKFAIENMGMENSEDPKSDGIGENMNDQTRELYSSLLDNLKQADESKLQDGYFKIISHRKVIGPVIVFIKKAMRKIKKIVWGWYLLPAFNRQTYFNGKTVNTLSLLKDIFLMQEQRIATLEKKLTLCNHNGQKNNFSA